MKTILKGLIRAYQYVLSPMSGHSCRFEPTCSHYALDAIEEYGAVKGTQLTFKRLLRCQPFAKAGYDPVPEKQAVKPNSPKGIC